MKIGFVTDKVYPFYVGGYERRYWELARRLSGEHEVHVFTSCPRDEIIQSVRFHRVAPYFNYVDKFGYRVIGKDVFYSIALIKKLLTQMDFIDCNATPFLYIPVAKVLAFTSRAKFVATVHEAFRGSLVEYLRDSTSWKNLMTRWFTGGTLPTRFIDWSLRLPDELVAVSKVTQGVLRDIFSLKNTVLVPNGIDLSMVRAREPDTKKGRIVTYMGRLSPEKRVEDLLEAVEHIAKNGNSDVYCRIIGDGPELCKLKKITIDRRIQENVRFYGYVDDVTKYQLLSTSDVFVLPSIREGFSISSLEALGCGLPLIAAKPFHIESSGVFELLKEGHNGYSYPSMDSIELSKRLAYVLDDTKKRCIMSRNAIETAQDYSWEKVIPLYRKVIEG